MGDSSNVQSLERGLYILELISSCSDGIGITAIADKSGLSKSTTHRLIQTLKSLGYLVQDPITEKYKTGLKVLTIYNNAISDIDVKYIAHKHLKELRDTTNESVQLAVRNGTQAVYIDKKESERSICMYSKVGKSIPLYCSSAGKALISFKDPNYIYELMKDEQFVRFTNNTIVSLEDLTKELANVRKQGYATDWFEHEDHVYCAGSPIFDHKNDVIAAVSVAGIVLSFSNEHYKEICTAVYNTAKTISLEMGCMKYPLEFNFVERDISNITELMPDIKESLY